MKKRILALAVCLMMLIGIPQAGAAVTLRGDADCDGKVTAADASLILRYTVQLSELTVQGLENADANLDKSVDSSDAAVILRHLVRLVDLADLTPIPSTTPTPKPTATPTPTAAPTAEPTLDPALYANVLRGTVCNTADWSDYAEDITLFIQALPESDPYRRILYAGATHMGTPYGTGDGQLDCSKFVYTVYRDDCKFTSEYPRANSAGAIKWFMDNQPSRIHLVRYSGGEPVTSSWKPGYVLAYVDSSNTGNHLSIYLGCVDGIEFVMESATRAGGVCIRRLWQTDSYNLKYYFNPLD